jgi:Tfp pilus assembly protein PilX
MHHPHRHRQRGFTLIIIFLLIILMVGVAATVMLSSQTYLGISGQDREATVAFYAAETAVAYAKDLLRAVGPQTSGNGAWTPTLTPATAPTWRGVSALCINPPSANAPATTPNPAATPVVFDSVTNSRFTFCIHNNALDSNFALNSTGATTDSDGIIGIEAYGYGGNGQVSHISVEFQASSTAAALQSGAYVHANDLHGAGEAGVKTSGALTQGL